MRRTIDFLDEMVREVLDFNRRQLVGDRKSPDFTINVLPAYPEKAALEQLDKIAAFWKVKYPYHYTVERHTPLSVSLHTSGLRLHLVMCYAEVDVRGSTCVGALIDTFRLLDREEQRALYNSMVTVRECGFPAYSITTPLSF